MAPDQPISPSVNLPRVLMVNINGNGTGHLTRCLAYADRLRGRARVTFFSMASAMEIIHEAGFEGDYFVSGPWSRAHHSAWSRELAVRARLLLEAVRPAVVVFDGTWPFHGLLDACDAYGGARFVWSNRRLHKPDFEPPDLKDTIFDLIIEPGEIGAGFSVLRGARPGRKVSTAPVTLLGDHEVLDRAGARAALGLDPAGRYALFSLGPGNVKDVGAIGHALLDEVRAHGFTVAWARAPITVRDVSLPDGTLPISVYPLVRYMRAFDVFVGAAGYNTCCEVIQSGVPALLVPNTLVVDDQTARAAMVARHARAVVSACEGREERADAVSRLVTLVDLPPPPQSSMRLDGAESAAEEILSLVADREAAA